MSMSDALKLDSRRRIYEFIRSRPGTFLREMERDIGMEVGMLSYHLKVLVDAGMVRIEQEGNHLRYFATDSMQLADSKTLSYLKNRQTRTILMFVLDKGTIRYSELVPLTGASKSTVTYHLKRLTSAGLVQVSDDRGKVISLTDPNRIMKLLLWVREDVERDAADVLIDIWNRLNER